MNTDDIVRLLTISSLGGLLLTVGLRLKIADVTAAVRQCPLVLVLMVNFLAVPALVLGAIKLVHIQVEVATGMLLLAAAPFAPVVPVFTRLARADLHLAAGLTTVIPLISVFLTPFVCLVTLKLLPDAGAIHVSPAVILITLVGTIVLPMALGIAIHHFKAHLAKRILRPIESVSEVAGALSLIFVTATQFRSILNTRWDEVATMFVLFEFSLWLGYAVGGKHLQSRRVIALGTSNRNIALALLVALQNFPGTPVVPAVVTNGFLLILLGLAQVGWWRFRSPASSG